MVQTKVIHLLPGNPQNLFNSFIYFTQLLRRNITQKLWKKVKHLHRFLYASFYPRLARNRNTDYIEDMVSSNHGEKPDHKFVVTEDWEPPGACQTAAKQ